MNAPNKEEKQEPESWKCSSCRSQSVLGCEVVDKENLRKICLECMADCCQMMLALGYFEMSDSERINISGFVMRDDQKDNLMCEIIGKQLDGYDVLIVDTGVFGLLISNRQFETGEKVLSQFVCQQNGRQLVMPRFGERR